MRKTSRISFKTVRVRVKTLSGIKSIPIRVKTQTTIYTK